MKEIDAIDPARSSMREFDLPSGFVDKDGTVHKKCVVREMTGYEEDILTSSSKKSFQKTQAILENCIQSIGTIDQESILWSSIVKGLVHTDRLFVLVQIRIASLGDSLSFEVVCPECESTSMQTVSLEEFKVSTPPDPSKRTWDGILPKSKMPYTARMQTGFDDEKVIRNKEDAVSQMIAQRLVTVNNQSATLDLVKKISMADRQYLRAEIKKQEGKMDDEIEIDCPNCGHHFSSAIDLASSNFFFPSET